MVTMMRKTSFICLSLLVVAFMAMPVNSQAQVAVGVSIRLGPPPLPVYVQPVCPAPGYMWTPGFWAYGPDGYYWVPGTWVEPPAVGVLWTPGYWGWRSGFYVWNAGYWGPHVGFYGGINYGFGYTGVGFAGGFWRGGVYNYNRSVTNVNTTIIHNTYNTTVVNNTTINRTSFNGGAGGIHAEPNGVERAAMSEHHMAPTQLQEHHQQQARSNRDFLASVNHGSPSVAASSKPGVFTGRDVVAANRGGNQNVQKNANFQKFGGNNGGSANNNGKGAFNQNTSNAYKGGNNGMNKGGNNGMNGGNNNPSKFSKNNAPNSKVAAANPHGNNNAHNGGQQHGTESHDNERRDHR
jgi:WXXGXW repeat (2 copies)